MMEVVQEVTFSVADADMNPGKLFPGIFRLDGLGRVLLNNSVQLAVAAEVVGFNSAIWIKILPGNVNNSIGSKILHGYHLEIPARICRSALFSFLRATRFSHNHDRCLAFTSSSSFQFTTSFPTVFGINSGKEPLIHFRGPGKSILLIPGTHCGTNLLPHIPNRFISFVPQLALDFLGRKAFIGGSHQMHYHKPNPKRKIGVLHHCTTAKRCPGSTLFALKLFNRFHPVVFSMPAFSALYAFFGALVSKGIPARLFIRELFDKLYKLHIHDFESKLRALSVTYLRWVYD